MTTLQDALPCPFCGKQHTLKVISDQELMGEDLVFWQHSESFGVVCDASQPEGKGGCGAMCGFKPTEDDAKQEAKRCGGTTRAYPLYTAAPAPQAQECTRSHPHELMDGCCELRTELARLTNENAILKAAPQSAQGEWINDEGRLKWAMCRIAELESALQSAQPVAQPLTDKRISWLWSESHNDTTDRMAFQVFARAIEAAHGIREVNER